MSNSKVNQANAKVDQAKEQMKKNLDQMLKDDGNLNQLEQALQNTGQVVDTTRDQYVNAKKLKKDAKYGGQSCFQYYICCQCCSTVWKLILLLAILVTIVVFLIVLKF